MAIQAKPKPVKKSKKLDAHKKLERKASLMEVRSLRIY